LHRLCEDLAMRATLSHRAEGKKVAGTRAVRHALSSVTQNFTSAEIATGETSIFVRAGPAAPVFAGSG
jgi:hypothetical protein